MKHIIAVAAAPVVDVPVKVSVGTEVTGVPPFVTSTAVTVPAPVTVPVIEAFLPVVSRGSLITENVGAFVYPAPWLTIVTVATAAAEIVQVAMLRADRRIIESGRNRVRI